MFTTFIVKPLFNLLVLIYALIPGHNFGLALIVFTIVVRLLLWPLVKKQLHQAKMMRKLQPEIKKIKEATKGNKQEETKLTMELYKEKGINPLSTFPILIIQFIVLIGLYSGINKIIVDPKQIVSFSYVSIQKLPWIKHLSTNLHYFDNTLFGFIDLSKTALDKTGIYWPAMIIVILSAVSQYYQSKQLMPTSKDQKSLREILRQANSGKPADQSEINGAVGKSTRFLLPLMIFLFTVNIAADLSLYWLASGVIALIQQGIALKEDEEELETGTTKKTKDVSKIKEAEIVPKPNTTKTKHKKQQKRRGK
jgi:membrane protein insertase, YidC/Oxa1 family, C-terminal domain